MRRTVALLTLIAVSAPLAPRAAFPATDDGVWAVHPGPHIWTQAVVRDPVRNRFLTYVNREVWSFDPVGPPHWTRLDTQGPPPVPRHPESPMFGTFDSPRDRMLIFDEGTISALTLDGAPTWSTIPSPPFAGVARGQPVIYDAAADRLLIVTSHFEGQGTDYPLYSARVWQLPLGVGAGWSMVGATLHSWSEIAAAWDPANRRVYVFGGVRHWYGFEGGPGYDVYGSETIVFDAVGAAWSRVPATGAPSGRYVGALVHDSLRDRLIVMGGVAATGWTNETWGLNLGPSPSWVPLAGENEATSSSLVALYDENAERAVAFNGVKIHALTLGTSPAWTRLHPEGALAPGRRLTSAIYDPIRRRMVVFGGLFTTEDGLSSTALGDAWALSLAGTPEWSPVALDGPRLIEHSAIYDAVGDRMVVFGGVIEAEGGRTRNTEVHALAFEPSVTWTALATSGPMPPWRSAHVAVYDPVRRRMIVFGGRDGTERDDVWVLTLDGTPTWTEWSVPNGPSRRAFATGIYDPARDALILQGGGYDLTDTWMLSLGDPPTWTELHPGGPAPPWWQTGVAVYDAARQRMVKYGKAPYGDDPAFALSLGPELAWSPLNPGSAGPRARYEPAGVYDPSGDRMVIFGGYSLGGLLSEEVWFLAWAGAPTAVEVSLVSVEAAPDRVRIVWSATEGGFVAGVERRIPGGPWLPLGQVTADGTGRIVWEDLDVRAGVLHRYRLAKTDGSGAIGEIAVDVPAAWALRLEHAGSNPSSSDPSVSLTLPSHEPATLEVLDLQGRRLRVRDVGALGPGRHHVSLSQGRSLAPGVYLVRLRSGERRLVLRLAMLR